VERRRSPRIPRVAPERSVGLGHSTVAFTLDVYSHAIPAVEEEAAAAVAALFVPGS
jgi:hypothetical protein